MPSSSSNPGMPKDGPSARRVCLVGEAVRVARSQLVGSAVAASIAAAVCGVIIATTGQTSLSERQILSRVDDAGTRSITVTDVTGDAGLLPSAVTRIAGLQDVQSVIGLSAARDGRNPALGVAGTAVPVRQFYGELPAGGTGESRPLRPPHVGEALAGQEAVRALGLSQPVGTVSLGHAEEVAVVGVYVPGEGPFSFLDSSVLTRGSLDAMTPLKSIHVITRRPQDVAPATDAVRDLLGVTDPGSIRVETSQTLVDIRAAVAGDLGRFSRQLVTIVLAVGLVLIGLNVYGTVTSRRRDFGRRRVLGASRTTIVVIVAMQTVVPAVVGAAVGSAVGIGLVFRWAGASPPPQFVLGTAILSCLISGIASLPPALIAAFRDPIRVLRVP